jgi:hypothetical protein
MGGTTVAELSDAGWEALRRELSARVAVFAPGWTEWTDSDPGITFLELFEFLAESLLFRPDLSPHARFRLREILERLEHLAIPDCGDGTLIRNRFFTGKLLTADDFEQEQSYHLARHRRHNRLIHGVGIVRGLGVSVEQRPSGGDPMVVVSPGVAISPDGEELVVCEPVTRDVCHGVSPCYLTLAFIEQPVDPTPEGEHSRIEESAEVVVSEDVPRGHLAIARVLHEGGTWRTDPSFKSQRLR